MRAFTAYFIGAGTIIAAIATGLGGGIVAGNIMNPVTPKQGPAESKMAQRAEPAAAAAATTNAPSERVPYLTGSQAFSAVLTPPAQGQDETKAETKPVPQTTQANAEPPAPQRAAAVEPPKETSKPTPAPSPVPRAAKRTEQQASTEPTSSPENAYAKARDSDVKRAISDEKRSSSDDAKRGGSDDAKRGTSDDAKRGASDDAKRATSDDTKRAGSDDVKRSASEQRHRTERRDRWADRRHYEPRDTRGPRERTDWDDVVRSIREDSDAHYVESRPRNSFPQIRLFGPDDDDD